MEDMYLPVGKEEPRRAVNNPRRDMMIAKNNPGMGCMLDERFFARSRATQILSAFGSKPAAGMVRQASAGADPLAAIKAIIEVLQAAGVKANIPEEKLAVSLSKEAARDTDGTSGSMERTIRIASKTIKESHYFIDVTSDTIQHHGRKMIMVCLFMREGYLGRYMIKRNFFYMPENSGEARETFRELARKAERLKGRYHDGSINVNDFMPEVKALLDGIRGDFEIEEDSIGSSAQRDKTNYHETQGPSYIRMAGHREPRKP